MKIRSLAIASLFALSVASINASTLTENFATDPLPHGWQTFGNPNLFHWNATNQNLEVTWDSTNANSYCCHPLGNILTRDDDFSVSFDLQVNDAVAFNWGSELAVGLFHFASATNAGFSRGGGSAPNIFEFDYFPDTGYGDSIAGTLVDTNGDYGHLFFIYENKTLQPGITYQVALAHSAGTTNMTGQVFTNGVLFSSLPNISAGPIADFRLDTLSISSYQDDGFGDSVLAHGIVDNFTVTLPPPPVQNLSGSLTGNIWQAQFISRLHWIYALERSADLQNWEDVVSGISGNGAVLTLTDPLAPAEKSFYRVRASRP